ncbi:AAA family ATPase [Sphingomonas azotifigens]|uniref:AAA family ATPase n=1 Tax=Sphingomonas azotifigens TaxID=330920 RepID=UPI000A060B7E|nr:AAA family ATPase [Sphingomonas azotifigens]
MTLDDLGSRICVLGPSNSGKSTLAVAIAAARGLEAIHLDQLHHLPHTDWVPRPADDFAALHDMAILGDSWVIEGNYTRLLPQRLARATGVLLLDVPTSVSLYRYVRRCWFERQRHGALAGGRDSVKWAMLHHILFATRANRVRYRRIFDDVALPKVLLVSTRAITDFYRKNDLRR